MVIVDKSSRSSVGLRFGSCVVGSLPQAPWFVLLRAGSVGWAPIIDVEGVKLTFGSGSVTASVGVTMFRSRRVCSQLLLFDVCCLLLASSRSLLLCLNLDMVLLILNQVLRYWND